MIRIEINTDNAAFSEGDYQFEIARILQELAVNMEYNGIHYGEDQVIRDVNGNVVGSMTTS